MRFWGPTTVACFIFKSNNKFMSNDILKLRGSFWALRWWRCVRHIVYGRLIVWVLINTLTTASPIYGWQANIPGDKGKISKNVPRDQTFSIVGNWYPSYKMYYLDQNKMYREVLRNWIVWETFLKFRGLEART